MNRKISIEAAVLEVIGGAGIYEGLRLNLLPDTQSIQGAIRPGSYILIVSVFLVVTGIAYFLKHFKQKEDVKKVLGKAVKGRGFGMLLILGIYILLIDVAGYLFASVVFFLLEFRMVGIRSLPKNVGLTAVLVGVYYVVFVHFCSMSFPGGILFR
jgi:hypothetical protein